MLTQQTPHNYDTDDCEITLDEIGDTLVELILPYYKGSIADSSQSGPQFRKSLTSDEVNTILLSLHDILRQIKMRERKEIAEAKTRHPASVALKSQKSA